MNLSGILVITPPQEIEATTNGLNALEGVEVYHTDPEAGHIVVVQEAESIEAEVAGLQRIKALPTVSLAEMVYHYFGDETQLAVTRGDPEPVPARLRN